MPSSASRIFTASQRQYGGYDTANSQFRIAATSISLRLPTSMLERIKIAANKRDVPYQSLIKAWLSEKIDTPHK